jgi:thymidylate synthase
MNLPTCIATDMAPAVADAVASLAPEAAVAQSGPAVSRSHEEYQYLDLVREILDNGEHRPDR